MLLLLLLLLSLLLFCDIWDYVVRLFFDVVAEYHASFDFQDDSGNVCDIFEDLVRLFPRFIHTLQNSSIKHWILARGVVPVVTSQTLDPVSFFAR